MTPALDTRERAANGSNAAAELTSRKDHQHQLQPGSDIEDEVSRIQPTVAQEQTTIAATSASISDIAFSPLTTHPESRPGLSATSPVSVNLTAGSCSPVDRELQPKIPTASSPTNLRASRYQVPVPGTYETLCISIDPSEHFFAVRISSCELVQSSEGAQSPVASFRHF